MTRTRHTKGMVALGAVSFAAALCVGGGMRMLEAADRWEVVKSPNAGSNPTYLYGVATISNRDAWAIGAWIASDYRTTGSFALHYDGHSWSRVTVPGVEGKGTWLWAIKAISATDIWVVGDAWDATSDSTLILHYDGIEWGVVPSPTPAGCQGIQFREINAVRADDIWAVGRWNTTGDFRSHNKTLILHYDGSTWRIVPSPSPGKYDNYLGAVVGFSSKSAISVGGFWTSDSMVKSLVERWDGQSWKIESGPTTDLQPQPDSPESISGPILNDCLAFTAPSGEKSYLTVGRRVQDDYSRTKPLFLVARLNKTALQWKSVTCPEVSEYGDNYVRVALAPTADYVLAVGRTVTPAGVSTPIVVKYRLGDPTWAGSISLAGLPGLTGETLLRDVSGWPASTTATQTTSNKFWAVGATSGNKGRAKTLILKGTLSD